MNPLAIVGLVAAIVGSATQIYAQQAANRAAQAKINEGYAQQRKAQDKVNQKIAEATHNYASKNREEKQSAEAERIAQDIKADVSESQAIRDAQQTTAGNVSSDYEQARAEAKETTAQEMNAFADLIGKIRSAGTLRQQEGWATNRKLQDIQQIGRNAQGDWSVAQARAQDALHSRDGLANFGKLLGAAGTAMSLGAGLAGSSAANAGATGATQAGAGAAAGAGVDAVSGAAPTVAPTIANKASLWWNGLSPAMRAGMLGGGALLGSAVATNPWRRG